MLKKRLATLLTALAMLAAASAAPAAYQLPDLGNPADTALPPAKAEAIGAEILRQLRSHDMILDDPEITAFVQRLGERLAEHGSGAPGGMTFFVVRNDSINAFALPGGYIGIHSGLITATEDVSELAAVMAHEIGHVVQNHLARQVEAQTRLNWATAAAMIAAIVAGAGTGNGELAQAAIGVGMSNYYQTAVSYTREHEMEADHVGIRILADAGFDPRGMVDFFERLEQQSRLYGSIVPAILQTHPVNTVRIAEARERAADYPAQPPAKNMDYRLARARTLVFSADSPSAALSHFRNVRAAGDTGPASTYGYALALDQSGQSEQAESLLRGLLEQHPGNVHYRMALADVLLNQGLADEAVALLTAGGKTHADYTPYVLGLADALIQAGQAAQARDVILAAGGDVFALPESRRLLAEAARRQGDQGEAYYQSAEYYRLTGDIHQAIQHLEAGLRLKGLDDNARARMSARLESLRDRAEELTPVSNRAGLQMQFERSGPTGFPAGGGPAPYSGCGPGPGPFC